MISSIYIKIYICLRGRGLGKLPLVSRAANFLGHYLEPKGDMAFIEVQGHKMCGNPQDIAFIRRMMFGNYEKYGTELFKKIVKMGDVVVDIGAHIGHYTLIAADLVGENGKVFAFEQAPDNYASLVKFEASM